MFPTDVWMTYLAACLLVVLAPGPDNLLAIGRGLSQGRAAAALSALGAGVGILFGLPSLWIKGFYLAVATLAAQFFIVWCLTKFPWFSNYSSSGVISAQKVTILGAELASKPDVAAAAVSVGAAK